MCNMSRFALIGFTLVIVAFAISPVGGPAEAQVYIYAYKPTPSPPHPGNYSTIHSVAVISAIGKDMILRRDGTITTKNRAMDLGDWQIDQYATQAMKSYLGSRFIYQDVTYDRDSIERIPNDGLTNSASRLRSELQKLPQNNVDAYIVLRPNQDFDANTPEGLSLYDEGGDRDLPTLSANFEIDIIDARTLTTIGRASSRVQLREGEEPVFASFVGSRDLKLSNDLSVSDKQRSELQPMLKGLLRYSILETLRALKPDAQLPPIGARVLAPLQPEAAPFQKVHSIAVTSAIGDQFEFKASTFFGYETAAIPISDWNLDAQIESAVRASLTKRIMSVDATFDRKVIGQSQLFDKDGNFAPHFSGLEPSQAVDAYLLILKLNRKIDPLLSPRLDGRGVGMYDPPSKPIQATPPAIYASYIVALVDSMTLKPMLIRSATVSPKYPNAFPYFIVDEGVWPKKPSAPTTTEVQAIQKNLRTLLNDSIEETLLQTGLTDLRITDDIPGLAPSDIR